MICECMIIMLENVLMYLEYIIDELILIFDVEKEKLFVRVGGKFVSYCKDMMILELF